MRIIDAHNHPDWHGHNFSGFVENMDEHGIEKTWLLSWECPDDEYNPGDRSILPSCLSERGAGPIPFSRSLAYHSQAPERFILGYAPDPRRPDGLDKLRAAVEIYGVRLCGELKLRMMCDNRDAVRMYRYCGEQNMPVTLHLDYEFDRSSAYPRPNYWYGGGIEALERTLKECPETIFLGHAPGFWAHISGDNQYDRVPYPKGKVEPEGRLPQLLHEYPNLYCDLSAGSGLGALQRDPEFALSFITQFQERLLFARDCFDGRLYDFLSELGLPGETLEKILCKNAEQLVT